MNAVFVTLVSVAFAVAGWRQVAWPGEGTAPMQALADAALAGAEAAVPLAIGLIGVMALFLGLMKVGEAGGLLAILARALGPLMRRLFPEVPPDHPAMGAMILNLSANMLGMGNAATPFGIRAMQELDRLNPRKGVATDAMALFLAINTAGVTLLPTKVIALRAASGSADAAGIVATTLFATAVSAVVAVAAARLLQRVRPAAADAATEAAPHEHHVPETPAPVGEAMPAIGAAYPVWVSALLVAGLLAAIPLMVLYGRAVSPWIIPGLIAGLLLFGWVRGVAVYEVFVEGAREGFTVAVRIIPYLVAILVAIGMLRGSGALDLLVGPVGGVTAAVGLPAEGLVMAVMRSLSGSGAYGLLAELLRDPAVGPDSYLGYLASTIYGSTETTFYVIAVYFGAVQIRRVRHALAAGLIADAAAVAAAVAVCSWLYG